MRNRRSCESVSSTDLGGRWGKHLLNFIEDNGAWLIDSEKTNSKGQYCQTGHDLKVGPREEEDIVIRNAMRRVVSWLDLIIGIGMLGEFRHGLAL